ncbi:MAG: YkgJ family cysteine cluster protein [Methanomassiliicoccales archaeon]|nr:YkgJ family cysteine cluster protein [Methanomassiliicoccales archaeon]
MRCTHCTKCCQDTRMELCQADIARLERRGHRAQDFMVVGEDGIPRLRNEDGFCHFFDRGRKRCREYASRPLGCVIYPVNLTEDGEVVVDELCPEWRSLSSEEMAERGKRLRKLLDTIDAEAAVRR